MLIPVIIPVLRCSDYLPTYRATYPLGVIGEYCPLCRAVRAFHLIEDLDIEHFYFMPAGKATQMRMYRKCLECQSETPCQRGEYSEVLALQEAAPLVLGQLLRRSNPGLADLIDEERRLTGLLQQTLNADPDLERQLALVRVRRCKGATTELIQFAKSLEDWQQLTPEARGALLARINEYLMRFRESERVVLFTQSYSRDAPKRLGTWAMVLGLLLLVAWWIPATYLLEGADERVRVSVILIGVMLLSTIGCFVYFKVRRQIYRRFFHHVVERAVSRRIELAWVQEVFEGFRFIRGLPLPIRGMWHYRDEFVDAIRRSPVGQEAMAAATQTAIRASDSPGAP
jgi:hypothetical protein